ncbi:MAG: Gmad2 immunoglobulin-like domain-containing protein [Anaerolineae bacterium]|nr:Gmad2 immunoglobulin-like domain-containing protein [Anaerolineae bacterium]NUQ07023.1 hypothetical protein [Anaerolineae bacterium]
MLKRSLFTFLLVFLAVFTAAAQSDEQPEDPRTLSFQVCDWGLIVIEHDTEQPAIFIHIDSPADYSAVGSAFTVSGTGAGLFEGNVIVEVSQFGGDVLFTGTTVLQTEAVDAVGTWSLDIDLGELAEVTPIFIRVYSESPEDGSTVAYDDIRLNANAEFGLRYVELTSPRFGEGVPSFLMQVEGMAGGAFENNLVIEVRDFASKDVLAETFATVQTEDVGGSGTFSAEVSFDAEPGTGVEVYAYQPAVADGEEVEISDIEFAIVYPLARTYDRILNVRRDDPILGAQDVCATAEAEFDNENIMPLVVNDVTVFEMITPTPLVNLSVQAAGSSVCPAPLRTRITNTDNAFNIEIYRDTSQPAACTMDLAPITQRLSLGTLPNPDYTITVNGELVEVE